MGDFKNTLDKLNGYAAAVGADEFKSGRYYKCAICGREYKNLEDRIACETKCLKERNEAEAAMKKAKLEEEKKNRMEEIEKKYKELNELTRSYIKDYGSIKLSDNCISETFPTLSKMLESWWF